MRESFGERKRERERDSPGILYTGYLLPIVKIKRERERLSNSQSSVTKLDEKTARKKWDKKASVGQRQRQSSKVNRWILRDLQLLI